LKNIPHGSKRISSKPLQSFGETWRRAKLLRDRAMLASRHRRNNPEGKVRN